MRIYCLFVLVDSWFAFLLIVTLVVFFVVILAFVCSLSFVFSQFYTCVLVSVYFLVYSVPHSHLSSPVWSSAQHSPDVSAAVTDSSVPHSIYAPWFFSVIVRTTVAVFLVVLYGSVDRYLACYVFSFCFHCLVDDFAALPHFWFQVLDNPPL